MNIICLAQEQDPSSTKATHDEYAIPASMNDADHRDRAYEVVRSKKFKGTVKEVQDAIWPGMLFTAQSMLATHKLMPIFDECEVE
ncbi:hypothetical protein LTR56_021835, partial [Elasticomyces elasticus]